MQTQSNLSSNLGSNLNKENVTLITIPMSHYCEKARWGLEWAKIPYFEDRHLMGFHLRRTIPAAKSDEVPVLLTQGKVLRDSTQILVWADQNAAPGRNLYPVDPGLRKEVQDLEDQFDEVLGVEGRAWVYTYLIDQLSSLTRYSKFHGAPLYQVILLPILLPFLKGKMKRLYRLSPATEERARNAVTTVYDQVAERLKGRKYLVSDAFTAADLTFAALSGAILLPREYGVVLPDLPELPTAMAKQIGKWRTHPAGEYALKLYSEYRSV